MLLPIKWGVVIIVFPGGKNNTNGNEMGDGDDPHQTFLD
jgi:hypothetical protein